MFFNINKPKLKNISFIYFILLFLSFILYLKSPSYALSLSGGVSKEWNINSARTEAFKYIPPLPKINSQYISDPYREENQRALLSGIKYLKNRRVIAFKNNSYAVQIIDNNNFDKAYYYNYLGELEAVDYRVYPINIKTLRDFNISDPSLYPYKIYKYSYPSGKLISVSIEVKYRDQYIFDPSGQFRYHWINDFCYDENSNIVNSRKTIFE